MRAACVHALGSFLSSLPLSEQSDQARTINHSIVSSLVNTTALYDASPVVRMELVVALQLLVLIYESSFTQLIAAHLPETVDDTHNSSGSSGSSLALNSSFGTPLTPTAMNTSGNTSLNTSSWARGYSRGGPDASATVSAMLSPTVSHHKRSSSYCSPTMHRAASAHSINTSGLAEVFELQCINMQGSLHASPSQGAMDEL